MNIRPTQRIAFTYPQRSGSTIESTLETRFGRVSSRQSGLDGVSVSSEAEGVVVLTGEVDSEENKRLAAVLARLEPGVRSVRNELTVRPAAQ
jgi:osmotically-inducible protein OsmY